MIATFEEIKVEYLSHDGSDNTIANTARVSMELDGGWENLPENYTEAHRDRLISYLAKHKHTSPFRHNSISIRCKVPIFLARQLGKHQAGLSWNEVSRRYVDTGISFYKNHPWRKRPTSTKQGSEGSLKDKQQEMLNDLYIEACENSMIDYNIALTLDVAPEQARMMLPQSVMVEYVWTGNLMAFSHVYNLRSDNHAQEEVREFAELLAEVIEPLFPVAWKALTMKGEKQGG